MRIKWNDEMHIGKGLRIGRKGGMQKEGGEGANRNPKRNGPRTSYYDFRIFGQAFSANIVYLKDTLLDTIKFSENPPFSNILETLIFWLGNMESRKLLIEQSRSKHTFGLVEYLNHTTFWSAGSRQQMLIGNSQIR